MPLRQLHRRARDRAAEDQLFRRRRPAPFQMFKPTLKMLNVEAVGHYAIRIDWNDGHNTGIYSFDHLRKICPCAECKAAKAAAEAQSNERPQRQGWSP